MPSVAELDERLRSPADLLVSVAEMVGLKPVVTSARRSYRVQARLYRDYLEGRSRYPAAKPGTSLHERGLAFDITVEPMEALTVLGQIWESFGPGFKWGGRFKDPIHFQWTPPTQPTSV